MDWILKIAICEGERKTVEQIVASLVDSRFIPEYFEFDSLEKLFDAVLKDEFDVLILDYDYFQISEEYIANLRAYNFANPIILLASNLDEFDTTLLITNGVDIILNPSNINKIGQLIHKCLALHGTYYKHSQKNQSGSTENLNEIVANQVLQKEIIELLKSEGELRENQEFFYNILENIPNLLYVKDAKTLKYTYINQISEKIIGYHPEEIIGKNVYELFSKDYAEFYNTKDLELIRNKKPLEISEEMALTKENKLKILYTKKILINDNIGEPKYLLGISEDMTEHYKAQEELRKSEMRFSKIFHSSPVAIFVISSQTKEFVDVNMRFLDIVGYSREEVIGKKLSDFHLIFDEGTLEILEHGLDKRSSFVNIEVPVNLGKANNTTLLLSLEQMEFSNEGWGLFMGLDITERKLADIEITSALDRQKELNILKTQFISMISHEFRTPLTTIMLSTDLLSRYSDKWQLDEREKHFARIKDTILKMTQLMENVLIIGRIDSGKFHFNPEILDLSAFCFSLVKSIEFSTGGSHKIHLETNGECPNAKFDENLLGLVINNLLSNAVKYSPNAKKVDFTINCNCNIAEFIIRDYGIGIPDEELHHLFQSFFRATNVGPIAGYGLGLSIVKKCVDTHNGKIDVRSKAGEGTTFIVTIPISEH